MIKFYAMRNKCFAISATIILIGLIMYFVNGGLILDIDFKGGAIVKYTYTGDIDEGQIETAASEALNNRVVDVQKVSTQNPIDNSLQTLIVLNMAGNEGMSAEEQANLERALIEKFPDNAIQFSESRAVEPAMGQMFINRTMMAIGLAFFFVILYVWYAFRKIGGLSAGIMAIVALLHDVLVVFLTFVIFRIPLDESFMTAALTIIGFSVNDTIVIYDRIRENTAIYGRKLPIDELVDKSINQSLTRSINTNVAVFVSILIIYIMTEMFGIEDMRSFSLPMSIGVVSGCYSTIFIAGPLWVMWQKHKEKTAKA